MKLSYGIVDTHAHFGLEKNKLIERTAARENQRGTILLRDMQQLKARVGYDRSLIEEDNDLEAYIEVMKENQIEKAWIHQLSFAHDLDYEILSNEDIAEAIRKYPDKLRGFASVDPYDKDSVEKLKYALDDLKLHGFKLNPNDYGGFYINDKKLLYKLYEECCDRNIPVSIHTGITPGSIYRMKHNYPLYVDDVAVDFPELTIIVEHMGFPWNDLCYSMVQRHKNMYVTITAVANIMIHNSSSQFMMQFAKMISMFGSEKILWGSDWTATPNLDEVLQYLIRYRLPLPMRKVMGLQKVTQQDIRNILCDNANRILA